ncbi:MAG: class I adenylate-forming enzyme family protein [Propionibacteriaceae bacterium]
MNTADYLVSGGADDAVAVLDADGPHTYSELRRAVAGMVLALDGLPARARVGIVGPNSFGWVVGYLASLSAGAVAVPVPQAVPPDAVADRLAQVHASAVVLGRREERRIGGRLPSGMRRVVGVPEGDDLAAGVSVAEDDDAVYLFTSGTTGSPRVVRVTHANIQANTDSILSYLGLTAADRILVVPPFSYAFGASLLHTHLRVGATLVIQPDAAFPQSIVDRLRTERCTGFAGVPSTFHLLLRSSAFGQTPLPDLRTIQQAGGKLARPLLDELVQAQPQARVFVMYGQTEATARLSYLPPQELTRHPGSIGIPGVELRVVTPDGDPVRPGQVGEIWARGRNISPGYLDDPEATQRKMPGGVLRTGDLAEVDEEGYIVDRQEDFIKPWGIRVGSQEVESAAIQLTEDVVLGHCRTRLEKHAVPSRVHFVERLPLNGKVVKAALRELCLGASRS